MKKLPLALTEVNIPYSSLLLNSVFHIYTYEPQ